MRKSIGMLAAALLLLGAGAALAAGTDPWDQALNAKYGNAWTRVSPAEYRAMVELLGPDVTTTETPQEVRAMIARGKELNRLYGNAWTRLAPTEFRALLVRGQTMNPVQGASSGGGGFDWGDAGIGVAVALGAVLLGAASLVALRRRGKQIQPGF